jgi:hypothetical protein
MKQNDDTLTMNRYLGKPCKHGHLYKGTGKTLRYVGDKACVYCSREKTRRWKDKDPSRKKRYYDPTIASTVPVVLSRAQKNLFKANCERAGLTQSEVIRELIREWNRERESECLSSPRK